MVEKPCLGRWVEGEGVVVKVSGGALQSRTRLDVLNGANVAAIGNGSSAGWELFQYRDAVLLGDGTYRLTGLILGQLGTDAETNTGWPIGSEVVFLNAQTTQIGLTDADRGLERYYRVGPSNAPVSDASYETRVETFDMIALRPLSPVHGKTRMVGADLNVEWIRRTRIDGDSWLGLDVPVGETNEQYEIVVMKNGIEVRRETVFMPNWVYSGLNQSADGASGAVEINVAQVSERFGAGPALAIAVTL